MSDRELLEEAAKVLEIYLGPYVGPGTSKSDLYALKDKITAALAAPEPVAMEMVRKIRGGTVRTIDHAWGEEKQMSFTIPDSEAAALIADYRRVRIEFAEAAFQLRNEAKLLSRWYDKNHKEGEMQFEAPTPDAIAIAINNFDAIAAKHGVKLEE